MWTKEITDMIINGVWATLYMTVASTVLGYVFGLPMGVLLAITDKEGLTPNAVVYKILDVIANIVRSIPFLILLILLDPIYETSCWTELWFHCNHCSTCYRSDSIYWTNGRIFY